MKICMNLKREFMRGSSSMDDCICNSCKNASKDSNKKPCSICMQWIDGFLEATQFEPKKSNDKRS